MAAGVREGQPVARRGRHLGSLRPIVGATGQLVAAAILLLPAAVVTSVRDGLELTPRRALAVGLLGVLGTGIAYILSYRLIADVGPTRAAVVTYLIPVVAVTVGVVFLHEPFSFRLVGGGLLTVGGIALLGYRRPVRPAAPADPLAAPHA